MSETYEAAYVNFDFGNPAAIMEELFHITTFAQKRTTTAFLSVWTKWINENQARIQFKPEETKEWAALVEEMRAAKPLQLKSVANRIIAFWGRYQRGSA